MPREARYKPYDQTTRGSYHRKMIRLFVIAILVGSSLAACQPDEGCPSLEKLSRADPVSDATTAHAQGDDRVLMLGGFVGTVPGAEGSALPNRLLEGTTDYTTEACYRMRPFALAYVQKYNATIVAVQATTTKRPNSN